jgi:type 1 glutamine amidotransferase
MSAVFRFRSSLLPAVFALLFPMLLPAQAPPTESVRPPSSHKVALAVTGLLGWRVGAKSTSFKDATFFDAATKTDAAGLGAIEAFSSQKVSADIAKSFDSNLSAGEQDAIRTKLKSLNLHLAAYHVDTLQPGDGKVLEFAKALGADMVIAPVAPDAVAAVDKMANAAGINVAIETKDPTRLAGALHGASPRLGIATGIATGMATGAGGVAADSLAALYVRPNESGLAQFLVDLVKQGPPPEEHPDQCSNCGRPHGGMKPLFIALDITTGAGVEQFEAALRHAMGYRIEQVSKLTPITSVDKVPADERAKIEAALPRQAAVKPKKPRKLLVIDLCPAGGYYHATIAHANLAIELMAKNTGAYEAVFSNDLNNLRYPAIKQYDGVFLNSVVGEVFPDPAILGGLLRFVREGGGVAGIHGSTYASMDLPEFTGLMGAADGPHRVEPATLKIDDPDSPLTRHFNGKGFTRSDEFYHFLPTGPYSRDKLHVLISIDAAKSDLSNWKVRPDNDYGSVWIRSYGKGRVFNCAMGHTPTLFATPELAQLILNSIQFILGDLPADTTPSARLSAKR